MIMMAKAKEAAPATVNNPAALIARKTGDWWQDDRRGFCAYCGTTVGSTGVSGPTSGKRTRDHVIPRAHKGRHVTIPACQPCNVQKGKIGLPEFMLTDYFSSIREKKNPNQWSLRDLWLVMALAAVEQARSDAETWPASPTEGD